MSESPSIALGLAVRRHALGWLVLANLVGVLLSVVLLHPRLSFLLGGAGYGRWMPVHMNGQLYGWCALPLVGMLFAAFGVPGREKAGLLVLRLWSLALGLGSLSWLLGVSSGKPFMDWNGWARPLMPLAMVGLWLLLVHWEELRGGRLLTGGRLLRLALLLGLAVVPIGFYWAAGRGVYPAANPDSGGATGASLQVSTLGILVVYGLVPLLLGLPYREGAPRRLWSYWVAVAAGFLLWSFLDRGDASHHRLSQILGLGSLLCWIPLCPFYFRAFVWSEESWRWLRAAYGWGCLLVVSGWLTFLPGQLEHWKFTHMLVAHAHLAMAGLVSCAGWAFLLCLDGRAAPGGMSFLFWQGACLVHIVSLGMTGLNELDAPDGLYFGAGPVQAMLSLRLLSGLLMLAVSLIWLREAWRRERVPASAEQSDVAIRARSL